MTEGSLHGIVPPGMGAQQPGPQERRCRFGPLPI